MTTRRPGTDSGRETPRDDSAEPARSEAPDRRVGHHGPSTSGLAQRRAAPRTAEEVEQRYVAARDAWTAAMRVASSGRPADLASLAIAQEAYEAAAAERERWQSGSRVPIPVERDDERAAIDVVVGQELAWRDVQRQEDEPRGLLGRLFGRRRER